MNFVQISTQAVSVDDAANLMSVSRSTVYRLLKAGKLKGVAIGRSRRILLRDLQALLHELRENDPTYVN